MQLLREVLFYGALALGSYVLPKLLATFYTFLRVLLKVQAIPMAGGWQPVVGHALRLAKCALLLHRWLSCVCMLAWVGRVVS